MAQRRVFRRETGGFRRIVLSPDFGAASQSTDRGHRPRGCSPITTVSWTLLTHPLRWPLPRDEFSFHLQCISIEHSHSLIETMQLISTSIRGGPQRPLPRPMGTIRAGIGGERGASAGSRTGGHVGGYLLASSFLAQSSDMRFAPKVYGAEEGYAYAPLRWREPEVRRSR